MPNYQIYCTLELDMMTSSNGNIFRVNGHLWNSPVSGEFPTQRPVTRSFDIFFDLRLNKRLSKQSWSWWFETLACPLWRQCNENGPPYRRQHGMHGNRYQPVAWKECPRTETSQGGAQTQPIDNIIREYYSNGRRNHTESCGTVRVSSSWPNDAILRQRSWLTWFRAMTCHQFRTKPLPKRKQTDCQLGHWEQISISVIWIKI